MLRTANGKSRDDNLSFQSDCLADQTLEHSLGIRLRGVKAATISRFNLQMIDILDPSRVAQNVIVAAANIAAEEIPESACAFTHIEYDLRRAEDVPGIPESYGKTVGNRHGPIVVEADKLPHGLLRVVCRIKRLDRWQAFFGALARNVFGIIGLDLR